MKFFSCVIFVLACSASPTSSEVLDWDCHFETRVDADGVAKEEMLLMFKVDTISQKAYMQGNAGFVAVEIYIGESAFSFTEKLSSGAIQTTTVMSDGQAVHSRNTVLFGEIVAAQHFGNCQKK